MNDKYYAEFDEYGIRITIEESIKELFDMYCEHFATSLIEANKVREQFKKNLMERMERDE